MDICSTVNLIESNDGKDSGKISEQAEGNY